MRFHPIAEKEVIHRLKSLATLHPTHQNTFTVLSQQVGLHHLYNVLRPLACDEETITTLEAFQSMKFDQNQIDPLQVYILNMKKEELDKDFRMNERIFSYE